MNTLRRAKCVAVGHYVPEKVLTNADLAQMVETSDEWIRSRTGIEKRRIIAEDERLSDMAFHAAQRCLANAQCAPESLDGIIVATSTGDTTMPAVGNIIQHRLGASSAFAFDIVNACSGFLTAMSNAAAFLEAGRAQRILVVAGDAMSPFIDWEDRNTCVLFGDGCGAVLMEAGDMDEFGVLDFLLASDGGGGVTLCIPASGSAIRPQQALANNPKDLYLQQDGRRVFNHAIRAMTSSCQNLMNRNALGLDDIDLFVPHQANMRIMTAVGERLGLREDQLFSNIAEYGNTTAATVPLALSDAQNAGLLTTGTRILITTFGAGYSWGAAYLTWGRA